MAVAILFGVENGVGLARTQPEQVGLATDVYYHAARAALEGGDFYAVTPPGLDGYYFLYPPIVMAPLLVYGLLGDPALAYAVQTAANLLTGGVLAWVMVRTVERAGVELDRVDGVLVAGFTFLSAAAAVTLVLGQVNLQLALAVALGATWIERDRETAAGAVLAAAATVKLYPALVGAWLVRRRAWRTIAAATATGLGLVVLGVVAFGPGVTEVFFTRTLPGEMSVGAFTDGPDPGSSFMTVRRQLSVVAPWLPADAVLPASILVMTPAVLASYRTFEHPVSRLVGLQATLLAILAVIPLEPFYLSLAIFPTIPLLYLIDAGPVDPGRARPLYLAGALVAAIPVTLAGIESTLALVPVPGAVASAILAVAPDVLAFALPPSLGVYAMLGACALYQHRVVSAGSDELAADPTDADATDADPTEPAGGDPDPTVDPDPAADPDSTAEPADDADPTSDAAED